MLRRILAVVTGFGVWSVIWIGFHALMTTLVPDEFNVDGSTDSSAMLSAYIAVSIVCSVVAGLVLALISRENKNSLTLLLGVILLGVGLMVQVISWAQFPLWYHVLFLALLIPATYFGARILSDGPLEEVAV